MSERETIFLMHNNQASLTSIAQTIGRATSTVSRELSRNRSAYSPSVAQERYEAQKSHCGRRSLLSDHQLLQLIRHLFLDLQWSPEEIAARLKLETSSFQISYTTIYRGIYSGLFDQKLSSRGARGVIRKLRHHGKSRHKKKVMRNVAGRFLYRIHSKNDLSLPISGLRLATGSWIL